MIDIIAILLIWTYVAMFLLLTARTARRSGKPVWLFSSGRERQTVPAVLFRTSFVLGCILPVLIMWSEAFGADVAFLSRIDLGTSVALGGLILMVIGGGLAIYAQNYMGNSWRIGAAEGQLGSIVSGGPFAYSRNPVFVGQIALFAGLAIIFPSPLQLFVSFAVVTAAIWQVQIEERVLSRDLGERYRIYQTSVRRWL